MKINSVSPVNISLKPVKTRKNISNGSENISFQGKHTYAKGGAALFGGLASTGAALGTLVMSGGLALPIIAAVGVIAATGGAVLGHDMDKGEEKRKNEKKS